MRKEDVENVCRYLGEWTDVVTFPLGPRTTMTLLLMAPDPGLMMHQTPNMSTLLLSELRDALWPDDDSPAPSPSTLSQVAENAARYVAKNLDSRYVA